jgi:hypothetical protein
MIRREIMFRGKCIDTKEWTHGYYYLSYRGISSIIDNITKEINIVQLETVGQFSDNLDMCGDRIFEFDVLRNIVMGDLWLVVCEEGCFKIKLIGDTEEALLCNVDGFSIVGNVFDNPEFMKQKRR